MKVRFLSISSGSCGNCYYLGTETYGFLIDAGIPVKNIKLGLRRVGVPFEHVMAIFVTHDHADHIKSLQTLAEKGKLPIYATKLTHEGIENSYCIQGKLPVQQVRYVEKEVTLPFRDFNITPFEVPHDGTDNVGYHITIDGKTFCFLTDLGHITETAASYIVKANYLILESNYEESMLQMGKYPQFLKDRVSGPLGHLSNRETATFLAQHFSEQLKYIWLCHLSEENNHPELAHKAVEMAMRDIGIITGKDVGLAVLKRNIPSELYVFE